MLRTNAVRMLEQAGIAVQVHEYPVDENDLSGVHVAEVLGIDPERLFKTLLLKGGSGGHFVCCIPTPGKIDLKKAARAAGEKRAEMLPMKELFTVTGYIRGGCSPVGMKKTFPTLLDESSVLYDSILVSAGVRGAMMELSPAHLAAYLNAPQVELMSGEE